MELFKKRPVAVGITVGVIVISLFLGFWRSAGSMASKTEKKFYDGVYNSEEKYTEVSIYTHLQNCVNYSLGLISVASDYENAAETASALRDSRQAMLDALDSGDIHLMYTANQALASDFDALYISLESADVTDDDLQAIQQYRSSFTGAESSIEKSGYNSAVTEFADSLEGTFPASVLGKIMPVEIPEYFA